MKGSIEHAAPHTAAGSGAGPVFGQGDGDVAMLRDMFDRTGRTNAGHALETAVMVELER